MGSARVSSRIRSVLASFAHRSTALERRLLRLLAARYSMRPPADDAPPYAATEDLLAPPGILNRSGMIALAMSFMNGNRLRGDYFEFGCWSGRTFRLAVTHHRRYVSGRMHFWLFDSFQGLPALAPVDMHPAWKAGDLTTTLAEFHAIADAARIPREIYTVTSGFYEETLTARRAETLRSRGVKAGLVYVDCDLYESTRLVLEFMAPLFQPGTVLCFDDFYCFDGDPERGEQRAAREFLDRHPDLTLVDYVNFGWHGKSFIVQRRGAR